MDNRVTLPTVLQHQPGPLQPGDYRVDLVARDALPALGVRNPLQNLVHDKAMPGIPRGRHSPSDRIDSLLGDTVFVSPLAAGRPAHFYQLILLSKKLRIRHLR